MLQDLPYTLLIMDLLFRPGSSFPMSFKVKFQRNMKKGNEDDLKIGSN